MISTRILLLLALVALPARARADAIASLCGKTPYPDLCASTLRSSPKGSSTPLLGIIIVDSVESTVKVAYEKAKSTERSTTDQDLKYALRHCRLYYDAILTRDVGFSRWSLTKGTYKFAMDYMTDASMNLGLCQDQEVFKPGHDQCPVAVENTRGKQLSDVAAAIAHVLYSGGLEVSQ